MCVCLIQGFIIFLVGYLMAARLSQLLAIPDPLEYTFISLVRWQCAVLALSFSMRVLGMILSAHQRMDISNYIGSSSLIISFSVQWVLFQLGGGVISLAIGALAAAVFSGLLQSIACFKLGLYPNRGSWGRLSWKHFKEIFLYGKDLLLVSVGAQMIMASQSVVITKVLGLDAAAVWGIGTRVYNLLNQIIWRISDMSGAALAEMMIRGEYSRLKERYNSVAMLSFSVAGWVAVSFCFSNSLFVTLWTHGKIHWSMEKDFLLGTLMVIGSMIHCHGSFILITKKIGLMRYIYFLEGCAFVVISFLVVKHGGLAGIIISSIACAMLFSGSYLTWRISDYFSIPIRTVALDWFCPMIKMMIIYIPSMVVTWYLSRKLSTFISFEVNIIVAFFLGFYLLMRCGVSTALKSEIMNRVPVRFSIYLKRLMIY
jgi:O-antigen/teichoic acid export membrane protein